MRDESRLFRKQFKVRKLVSKHQNRSKLTSSAGESGSLIKAHLLTTFLSILSWSTLTINCLKIIARIFIWKLSCSYSPNSLKFSILIGKNFIAYSSSADKISGDPWLRSMVLSSLLVLYYLRRGCSFLRLGWCGRIVGLQLLTLRLRLLMTGLLLLHSAGLLWLAAANLGNRSAAIKLQDSLLKPA